MAASTPIPVSAASARELCAWIDASAGVAGDMLLGALVDAGASLEGITEVVETLIPGSVRLHSEQVTRAGQRATKVHVELLAEDPPHRTWRTIQDMLHTASSQGRIPERTAHLALEVFELLAAAEGHVHGIDPQDVHFHEVGALDSIADVVGVCEAWRQLGITAATGSFLAVGSGRIRAAHGDIPVPVPAVAQLSLGWPTESVGRGELATPTGVALLRTLCKAGSGAQPRMTTHAVGCGAGSKDVPERPNVVRVFLGTAPEGNHAPSTAGGPELAPQDADATPGDVMELRCNVDDLDPRVWPGVMDALLADGALDAWLTPIIMKGGRPAHTLHVLTTPETTQAMALRMMDLTATLGVRYAPMQRYTRVRHFETVNVAGVAVRMKWGGAVWGSKESYKHLPPRPEPEFKDVQQLARTLGITERQALNLARAAASDL